MKIRSATISSRDFLVFILLCYALVLSPFLGVELRNYLVLFAGALGGALFYLLGLPLRRQAFWALAVFAAMTLVAIFNGGQGDLGSVALTFIYCCGYFSVAALLERVQDRRTIVQAMMRWVIYAFTAMSVVQMATSLTGLPIPNVIASKGLWSYNSFAYEPSQLGRIVGITYLCYLMMDRLPSRHNQNEESRHHRTGVLLAFLTTMLLSGSAIAALAILLVIALSRSIVWIIILVAVSILIWPAALVLDYEPLQRAARVLSSLGSLDINQVLEADHSGGLRFAALLVYIDQASAAEPGFWFGYGSEGLYRFFQYQLPGLEDGVGAGFLPGFAVVYGILITTLFTWVFLIRQTNRTTAPLIAFWWMFITSSAWNTQVFWYGLITIQLAWIASKEVSRKGWQQTS